MEYTLEELRPALAAAIEKNEAERAQLAHIQSAVSSAMDMLADMTVFSFSAEYSYAWHRVKDAVPHLTGREGALGMEEHALEIMRLLVQAEQPERASAELANNSMRSLRRLQNLLDEQLAAHA